MASESHPYDLLDRLAEEFAERYRRGERPALQEFLDRHPELADDIREMLPAMVEIEQVKEDAAVKAPAAPLRQLGDFRILREVGHGGMGVVYEAEQVSLGRHVALKVLTQRTLADDKQRRRFEREARAAGKLHHTNIVPVFGVGDHEGTPYYVMQFIAGKGLDTVLDELRRLRGKEPETRDGPAAEIARSMLTGHLAPADGNVTIDTASVGPEPPVDSSARQSTVPRSSSSVVLPGTSDVSGSSHVRRPTYWTSVALLGAQVADALEYAHKQGILHRDVKPSNLLLDTRGIVWVTDFGLAKVDDQENLTGTGDLLGTLRYMPPEAFEGKGDGRGDVYSLGLTLYELLALRPAFDEGDRNKLLKQVMAADPPRLRKLDAAIPRDLATVVHKAIDRDPARRYASAGALAADLGRFLRDEPIHARRTSELERLARWARRNPTMAGLLSAVVALLIVIAGVSTLV